MQLTAESAADPSQGADHVGFVCILRIKESCQLVSSEEWNEVVRVAVWKDHSGCNVENELEV